MDEEIERRRHNLMLDRRRTGMPGQPATPESDADPRNPNQPAPSAPAGAIDVALDTIARVIQSWLDWHRDFRTQENLVTDGNTVIMGLPVPKWPSHGQLEKWVIALNEARAEILRLRSAPPVTEDGWRDISTAPIKQEVLFWTEEGKYMVRGYKIGHMDYFARETVPVVGCTIYSTSKECFTRWRPLPPPPSAEG